MREEYGTPAFWASYQDALSGKTVVAAQKKIVDGIPKQSRTRGRLLRLTSRSCPFGTFSIYDGHFSIFERPSKKPSSRFEIGDVRRVIQDECAAWFDDVAHKRSRQLGPSEAVPWKS
ncbi:MAG: hypothetical protein ABSF53_27815 [Terracidiphilus sp.]